MRDLSEYINESLMINEARYRWKSMCYGEKYVEAGVIIKAGSKANLKRIFNNMFVTVESGSSKDWINVATALNELEPDGCKFLNITMDDSGNFEINYVDDEFVDEVIENYDNDFRIELPEISVDSIRDMFESMFDTDINRYIRIIDWTYCKYSNDMEEAGVLIKLNNKVDIDRIFGKAEFKEDSFSEDWERISKVLKSDFNKSKQMIYANLAYGSDMICTCCILSSTDVIDTMPEYEKTECSKDPFNIGIFDQHVMSTLKTSSIRDRSIRY